MNISRETRCSRLLPPAARVLLLLATGAAVGADYQVIDLGHLGGGMSSASAINAEGVVTGVSTLSGTEPLHAFRWSGGSMVDLGALPARPQSSAFAINNDGDVVGLSYALGGLNEAAARWTAGGGLQTLGDFAARDINDAGVVVGTARENVIAVIDHVAVRWENGTLLQLSTLGGDAGSALGINNNGWIVGQSETAPGRAPHAFVWINGAMHDLGTLGGAQSNATDINDAGQVVGAARRADGIMHAFLFQVAANGTVSARTDLGELGGAYSAAYAVNNQGRVVGTSFDQAFLYENGVLTNLNNRIPAGSGWVLTRANGINDQGQIVGEGRHNGAVRGFLLTPIVALPGDMNCDGVVSVGDIGGFVLAITDPKAYAAAYPGCDLQMADVNGDGVVSVGDIGPFVTLLTGR